MVTQLRLDIEAPDSTIARPPTARPPILIDAGGPSQTERMPRLSIGTSLAALVAACLVPSLIALGVLVDTNYRAQERAVVDTAVARARTTMLLVDRDLEGVESGLRVLASSRELATNDLGRFHERLRDALKSQTVDDYVIVDRERRTRLDALVGYGTTLPDSGIASRVEPVFTAGRPALSGVFPSSTDRSPVVAMGVPVYRGTEVAYALVVALRPDRIIASARDSLPEGWIASVVDENGHIVARSRDGERFVGESATPSLLDATRGRPEGTAETVSKDGIAMLTGFSRSSRTGWTVAVGAPKAVLLASLHRSIGLLLGGASLVLGLVLWLAFRLSRTVTRAVDSLIEPALALGGGTAVELTATPFRETAAVGRAILQASRRLVTAQHHAYHDPLTNLHTRTLFDEMATRQIVQAYRDGAQLAILAIDLDGFKSVNDQHGHAAGDRVLKIVAERITGTIRGSDVVSRRGGDEFSVLLVDVDGQKTRAIADKILATLSAPYPDVDPEVSASIGVARYPHDATTLTELLARADEALYTAKKAGKRRVAGDL